MSSINHTALNKLPVHFIIGAARSGTTLLRTILNAHPQVVSTGEVRYVMALYGKYAQSKAMPASFVVDFAAYEKSRLKNVGKAKRAANVDIAAKRAAFAQLLAAQAPQLNYADVCKLLLLGNKATEGDKTPEHLQALINKNPDYIFYVEELLSVYPNAKILACIRDPRSVVLSHKQNKGKNDFSQYMGDSVAAVSYFWEVCNQAILALQQKYPQQIMLVLYEDLVNNKERLLHDICHFLNISFDEVLLNHQDQNQIQTPKPNTLATADTEQETAWQQKKQADLSKSIYTNRLAAWKTELSNNEIAVVETFCSSTAAKLGYENSVALSNTKQMWLRLLNSPQIILSYVVCSIFIINYFRLPFKLRLLLAKYLKIRK